MLNDVCDCHFHVFGSTERYPLIPSSRYIPPVATITDHRARFEPLGVRRWVLVQPSCYGGDNRCLLEALATLGASGRAVAAIHPDVSDAELARMHGLGVRGIRVNAVGGSTLSIDQLRTIAPRLKAHGLHVQTFVQRGQLAVIADDLLATGLTVVLDHFGSPEPQLGLDQTTQRALLRLLESGRCWVKLSAPFRVSAQSTPYLDMIPYALDLLERRPDRLVWGSDWPYIHFIDKLPPDYDPLAYFTRFIDNADWLTALTDSNPRALYQFD